MLKQSLQSAFVCSSWPWTTAFQKGMLGGHWALPHSWQFLSCYNSAKEHRGFPSQVPSWFWLLFISSPCLNSCSKIEEVLVLNPRSACNEPWFQLQEQLLLYKPSEFTYSSGGHRTNLRTRLPLFVSLFFFKYIFWNILTFEWLQNVDYWLDSTGKKDPIK